jgi:integrase/recombinase XerD
MRKSAKGPIYKRPGSPFWQISWTASDGRKIIRSSGTEDYKVAEAKLAEFTSVKGLWVVDVATQFFSDHEMSPKTRQFYLDKFKLWAPHIKTLRMEQITEAKLKEVIALRRQAINPATKQKIKPGTIRGDLRMLSSMFTYAMGLPGGPMTNPVIGLNKKALKPSGDRVRWFEPHELTALLAAIRTDQQRLMARLGLEAGLRRNEILSLRVYQVDLGDEPHILLRAADTKSRRGRRVPLTQDLTRTLRVHLADKKDTDLVLVSRFGKALTGFRPWWPNALKAAGLKGFTFHDTRHHFASRYIQRGGSLERLQKLLGHSKIAQTQIYAHLAPGDAEAEFRRLDAL